MGGGSIVALWISAKPLTRYLEVDLCIDYRRWGLHIELIWGIMALFRSVVGQVHTLGGLSDQIHSAIGVKQGWPLSPTLFGMYVDEVCDYIQREGDKGAQLART